MSTLTSLVQHSSGSVLPRITRQEKEIMHPHWNKWSYTATIRLRQDLYETLKTPPVTTIKTNKLSNIARYEPSEREQNSPIYKCIQKKNTEINLTKGQKHLYSHGLQDIESGFKSQLTCWPAEWPRANCTMIWGSTCSTVKWTQTQYLLPGLWNSKEMLI